METNIGKYKETNRYTYLDRYTDRMNTMTCCRWTQMFL